MNLLKNMCLDLLVQKTIKEIIENNYLTRGYPEIQNGDHQI